ncbi:hypothetical protein C8R46DRAFT_1035127 [Mycena filopes]|nr:hypothetical protein C8R46DRAFT_1035127 [Mycena filopes]
MNFRTPGRWKVDGVHAKNRDKVVEGEGMRWINLSDQPLTPSTHKHMHERLETCQREELQSSGPITRTIGRSERGVSRSKNFKRWEIRLWYPRSVKMGNHERPTFELVNFEESFHERETGVLIHVGGKTAHKRYRVTISAAVLEHPGGQVADKRLVPELRETQSWHSKLADQRLTGQGKLSQVNAHLARRIHEGHKDVVVESRAVKDQLSKGHTRKTAEIVLGRWWPLADDRSVTNAFGGYYKPEILSPAAAARLLESTLKRDGNAYV